MSLAAALALALAVVGSAATYRLHHADSMTARPEEVVAAGDVVLERTGPIAKGKVAPVVLKAETIVWTPARYRAERGAKPVRMEGETFAVEADFVEGDPEGSWGYAARGRLFVGSWRFAAGGIVWSETEGKGGVLRLDHVTATTCDREPPHYLFRASSAEAHPEKGWVSLRNITMRVGRVPVLWLPYLGMGYGENRTPVSIDIGSNGIEGRFVKAAYRYRSNRWGRGAYLLDYRSQQGFAYGIAPELPLDRGGLDGRLYRMEVRHAPPDGEVKLAGDYDATDRLRVVGHLHRVSSRSFRDRFFFEETTEEPEPENDLSATYRGRGFMAALRAVGNLNRTEYEVLERLPEARIDLFPWPFGAVEGRPAGYLSGRFAARALRQTDRFGTDTQTNRYEAEVRLSFPRSFGPPDALRVTPHIEGGLYRHRGSHRGTGEVGVSFSTMRSASIPPLPLLRHPGPFAARMRPFLSVRRRWASDWSLGDSRPPVVLPLDDFDFFGEAEEVAATFDFDLVGVRPFRRILRVLTGGAYDAAREDPWRPATLKVSYLPRERLSFDLDADFDPNEGIVRRLAGGFAWESERGYLTGSVSRANGEQGMEDVLVLSGAGRYRFTEAWEGEGAASFDAEEGVLNHSFVAVRRYTHDFVLELAVLDERRIDRTTIRFGVGLRALGGTTIGPAVSL